MTAVPAFTAVAAKLPMMPVKVSTVCISPVARLCLVRAAKDSSPVVAASTGVVSVVSLWPAASTVKVWHPAAAVPLALRRAKTFNLAIEEVFAYTEDPKQEP